MQTLQEDKQAVIYCRVSTKEQAEDGNSLVTQEKNCREYAEKYNYQIARVFIEEGESAKTADRTQLQNLLAFCSNKKNKISAVIIYKIDRLSRNTDDYSYLRIALKRYGVEIKSTSEYFENTPAGRFMENMIANVAQFDNDVRTERSVGGMRQAVLEGRYVWKAPFGYVNGKINDKSNILKTSNADLVKEAFEEVAKGIYSTNEVRLLMARRGLTTTDGQPLSKTLFYRLLKNEIYTGWICMLGERVKGCFEPTISEELFHLVRRKIQSVKKTRTYILENPDFPLRRFVRSQTHDTLTGSWCQGKLKKYPYYRFPRNKRGFRKEFLEHEFVLFLQKFALSARYYRKLVSWTQQQMLDKTQQNKIVIDSLQAKEKQLQQKKAVLIEKCLSGVLSDVIVKDQVQLLENELWEIHKSMEMSQNDKIQGSNLFEKFEQFFLSPGEFWKQQPFEIKRYLQKFEFPEGVTFDGLEFQTQKICSLFNLKENFLCSQCWKVNQSKPNNKHPKHANCPPFNEEKFMVQWEEIKKDLEKLDQIITKPAEEKFHFLQVVQPEEEAT